jgi:hypothetical protein
MKKQMIKSRTEAGQGFLEYGLLLIFLVVAVVGTVAVLGESSSGLVSRAVNLFRGEQEQQISPETTDVTVQVVDFAQEGISDVPVAAFLDGAYSGRQLVTDDEGLAVFEDLEAGNYSFRADYQAKSFWSEEVDPAFRDLVQINTEQGPFEIRVEDTQGNPLPDVDVAAYTENGSFSGQSGTTQGGIARLEISRGDYTFRAEFQGQDYWSDVISYPEIKQVTIQVDLTRFEVKVVDREQTPIPGTDVHTYLDPDSYTGLSQKADQNGTAAFDLQSGTYRFRVDYLGETYWSDSLSVPAAVSTTLEVGPYNFLVTVTDQSGSGMSSVPVYVYDQSKGYTGIGGRTDNQGTVSFKLSGDQYYFRADYGGDIYWTDAVDVPESLQTAIKVGTGTVRVQLLRPNKKPVTNSYVFIYSYQTNSYLMYQFTDQNGSASFQLSPGRYVALGYQFFPRYNYEFSSVFMVPGTEEITIRMK